MALAGYSLVMMGGTGSGQGDHRPGTDGAGGGADHSLSVGGAHGLGGNRAGRAGHSLADCRGS